MNLGLHYYKYIINGTNVIVDPYAPAVAPDGKGGIYGVFDVAE